MRRIAAIVLIFFLTASSSRAFDNVRRGFLLGGGFGYGPMATMEHGNTYENFQGIGSNFLIGYGWNERNMIVFLDNGIWHDLHGIPVVQGFSGPAWFHFFSTHTPSLLIGAGAGVQALTSFSPRYRSKDFGISVAVATGYEFVRHFLLYGSICWGKTADSFQSFQHTQIQIGLSTIAY